MRPCLEAVDCWCNKLPAIPEYAKECLRFEILRKYHSLGLPDMLEFSSELMRRPRSHSCAGAAIIHWLVTASTAGHSVHNVHNPCEHK